MKRPVVGVVARPGLLDAAPVVQELAAYVVERGAEMCIETSSASLLGAPQSALCAVLDRDEVGRRADMLVVLGGDGTFLGASHLLNRDDVPVIGVNFGSLGFLTEITPAELLSAVDAVLSGDYPYEARRMLRAVIRFADGREEQGDVLNDVVVSRTGEISRIIELDVFIDGVFVSSFRADGLIVASPTGSTAYNLAAGGPILHQALTAIVITPICPHTLTHRPLVLRDDARIEIRVERAEVQVNVTLDGQRSLPLKPGGLVSMTRSSRTLRLVRSTKREYFEVLRTKLRWGESGARRRR